MPATKGRTFNVYVAYYDHTETIVREGMVTVRARDEEHAEHIAMKSREWNFAAVQTPEPETAGIGETLL